MTIFHTTPEWGSLSALGIHWYPKGDASSIGFRVSLPFGRFMVRWSRVRRRLFVHFMRVKEMPEWMSE